MIDASSMDVDINQVCPISKPHNYTPTKIPESAFVDSGIFFVSGFERPLRKYASGIFLDRGRILRFLNAPHVGVDRNQICPTFETQ